MVAVVYMERDLLAADESCIGTSSFCDAGRVMDSRQNAARGKHKRHFSSLPLSVFYFSFFFPPVALSFKS